MRPASTIAGVLVAAGVAVAAVVVTPRERVPPLDRALRDLGYRPYAGRLSGSAWAPARTEHTMRSGRATPAPDRLLLARAALKLRSSEEEDVRAAGALIAGDAHEAALRLGALASRTPSARLWNDLAVAQHALAADDVEGLCDALAAAERALDADPRLPEARFNRAVILESLGLARAAAAAYEDYLGIDGSSPWAAEAQLRLRELTATPTLRRAWRDSIPDLRRAAAANDLSAISAAVTGAPQEARTWAETEFLGTWADAWLRGDGGDASVDLALARAIGQALHGRGESMVHDAVAVIDDAIRAEDRERLATIARAQALYRASRGHYHARDAARALAGFRDAFRLFEQVRSPMALVVEYYIGNAAIDVGERDAALAASVDIARRAPARYAALRALNAWLRGALYGIDTMFEEMLRAYEQAHAQFAVIGEQQNATNMLDLVAATASILGRTDEAWRLRRQTFAAADASGIPQRLELALFGAAVDAARERKWDVASALLGLATAVEGGNARVQAEAAAWRALASSRAGLGGGGDEHLAAARQAAARIADPSLRDDAGVEVLLVEALIVRDTDPSRALSLLTRYVDRVEHRAASHRLGRVLEERAAALETLRRFPEARADLDRAIALVERQRTAVTRDDLRDSFIGSAGSAYERLGSLLDAQGDTVGALAALDRRRARMILDRVDAPTRTIDAGLLRQVPPGTAVLSYGFFDSRTVVYASTARGVDRYEAAGTSSQVEELASVFIGALARGAAGTARNAAARLHALLIEPARASLEGVDRLVFVVDAGIQRMPFAALLAGDGSFLIERYSILVAPSIAGFLHSRPAWDGPPSSVVAVGNPSLDPVRFPGLAPLAGAEQEARAVASLYPRSLLLTGSAATESAVRDALPSHEVVDVAAHALLNEREPRQSRLLLAADGRHDGVITTADIAAMRVRARVVVLAGCDTAHSGRGYGDVRSLAAAFLAAGAPTVVAASWALEDESASRVSIAFHRALRSGTPAADALRTAQLLLLRSADARLREPTAWAALQVYGYDAAAP